MATAVVAATAGAVVNPLQGAPAGPAERRARNVIFMVGDGMAAAHREAGRLHLAGLDGRLAMDSLPYSGLYTTSPADPRAVVTDSAAGATAWAVGQRSYNGAISVDVDGNPLPALGAQAKRAGKRTGLVTTAQVTDATPAAFFSNAVDRARQDDIARQFLEVSRPDVILGGGEDWWLPAGTPGAYPDQPAEDPAEGSRSTVGNLVEQARDAGYTYVSTAAGLAAAPSHDRLLGLFANEEMFQQQAEGQGDVYDPVVDLATMTRTALDHLSAAHPDTLLIVVGDHECGGLTVEDVDPGDETGTGLSTEDGPFPVRGSDKQFVMDWTTQNHTGVDIPLTADGPGAGRLTGKHPNTYVHEVLEPVLTRR